MKAPEGQRDFLIFQFRLRFDPAIVPHGASRLQEKLREWFVARGFDYSFGALGGMAMVYGDVGRRGADATLQDRDDLAHWLRQQQVQCQVGLGDLEPQSQANIRREVTEVTFDLDNLTEADRREGEEFWRQTNKYAQSMTRVTQFTQRHYRRSRKDLTRWFPLRTQKRHMLVSRKHEHEKLRGFH